MSTPAQNRAADASAILSMCSAGFSLAQVNEILTAAASIVAILSGLAALVYYIKKARAK